MWIESWPHQHVWAEAALLEQWSKTPPKCWAALEIFSIIASYYIPSFIQECENLFHVQIL